MKRTVVGLRLVNDCFYGYVMFLVTTTSYKGKFDFKSKRKEKITQIYRFV